MSDPSLPFEVNAPSANLSDRTEFQKSVQFNPFTGFTGETNMAIRIFSIASALVPALGVATSLTQPVAHAFAQFDQAGITYQSTRLWPYDHVSVMFRNAAYVGDGYDPSYLRDKQHLMNEPGYSIPFG
jgi:hypothetical protein